MIESALAIAFGILLYTLILAAGVVVFLAWVCRK